MPVLHPPLSQRRHRRRSRMLRTSRHMHVEEVPCSMSCLSPFASICLPATETLEAVRLCMNRCLLGGGRWDYQRMSRLLDAPELAAVLSEADPFKPSTEDKLEVGW